MQPLSFFIYFIFTPVSLLLLLPANTISVKGV